MKSNLINEDEETNEANRMRLRSRKEGANSIKESKRYCKGACLTARESEPSCGAA